MKQLSILALMFFLAACASPSPKSSALPQKGSLPDEQASQRTMTTEVPLREPNTLLRIEFDDSGNWVRISTTASAALAEESAESPAALETAYLIATLRAKRGLAEFLSTDVRSTRTMKRVARTLSGAPVDTPRSIDLDPGEAGVTEGNADTTSLRQTEQAASTLTERIAERSAAILRGAHVARRSHQEGTVVVEVAASRMSIDAAREVSRRMSGALR